MVSESWQPGDLKFSAARCIALATTHCMHGACEGQILEEQGKGDNELSNEQEDQGQSEVCVTQGQNLADIITILD